MESRGFERDFLAGGIAFDPHRGIRGAVAIRIPEGFGVNEEIFEKWRGFGQVNGVVAGYRIFPELLAPGRIFTEGTEDAIFGVFEEGVTLIGEEGIEDGFHGHYFASIFNVRRWNDSSTFWPVFALVRSISQPCAASCSCRSFGISHRSVRSALFKSRSDGTLAAVSEMRSLRARASSRV